MNITFDPGEDIDNAAQRLCAAAAAHGSATGTFNEIELHAERGYAPGGVVKFYYEERDRRHEAWVKSPEGQASRRAAEQRRADMQAKHDALMARLPKLDMSNDVAVLDWLCEMQEPSDHSGVIAKRQTIVSKFEAAGYRANENVGAAYQNGDRNNMFRYLVGQALSGLKEGPAIHPILHKFADEWREQFARAESVQR